jgi:hypothetical protein
LKSNYPSYFQAKHDFQNLEEIHKMVASRVATEKTNLENPKNIVVEIIGAAKPPEIPTGPNRRLGAAILVAGLFLTVGWVLLLKSSVHKSF